MNVKPRPLGRYRPHGTIARLAMIEAELAELRKIGRQTLGIAGRLQKKARDAGQTENKNPDNVSGNV